ncbi:MAG: nucleotide pyrophosphatase [Cyanothece sp. SIO2G6]|nr:nucleotide pyrophosphatase [Cyanothece sp. SIO2G6]
MKRTVIAIGLDAADPSVIEKWMSQGYLKNIRQLRDQGAYGRLKTFDHYRAETPWTTFLTGCSPKKTGYWSPIKYYQETYTADTVQAYDYSHYKPFYAVDSSKRVAIVDMPHARLCEDLNGVQMMAWGAHSPQGPSESSPAPLFQEMVEQYGEHPVLRKDGADTLNIPALKTLLKHLKTGVERRAQICQDLIQREAWDFFLTVFGETHSVGHYFWHFSQPDHPWHEEFQACFDTDPMLEIFEAIDRGIGDILAKAPSDAQVVVFAAHGMGANTMDLPSLVYLPEFMYRFNFPEKRGIAPGTEGTKVGKYIADEEAQKNGWAKTVWNLHRDPNLVRRFLRSVLPQRAVNRFADYFDSPEGSDLRSPFWLKKHGVPQPFQPAIWYSSMWPQMKAFALPSFSEGYIRINLKGREAQGIVDPSEYHAVCDEIITALQGMKDARTGQPMVERVERTRQNPLDNDPNLPDADIVVIWQEKTVADAVDIEGLGRIGPVPFLRTGSHRADGFIVAKCDGVEAGSSLEQGHSLDLAPTLMHLMDAPLPDYFDGKPLIKTPVPVA